MDADTTKPSAHWKIPSCCSQQSAKGLHKRGLPLCCDLHWALIFSGPRQGAQACPLGCLQVTKHLCDLYTDVLKAHKTANSQRHKTHVFILCYSPDFLCSQLQGHFSVFTLFTQQSSTLNPLLSMSCHLHYSNFCG